MPAAQPTQPAPRRAAAPAGRRSLAAEVFAAVSGRLAERAEAVAAFAGTGASFEEWAVWEALDAGRLRGWIVAPKPRYAELGVAGSRESADLVAFDPSRGRRALVELAIIHDWSGNTWIDRVDGDTARLRRPLAGGVEPLQIVVALSPVSPIEVNEAWRSWLGMTEVWDRPTDLVLDHPLGAAGQMLARGWVL